MGRGRQKAKQTRIARKLKYLTTDTNYDELQEELSRQDSSDQTSDQFRELDRKFQEKREMDEYAQWAVEAAAKAKKEDSDEKPKTKVSPASTFAAMQRMMAASSKISAKKAASSEQN